MAGEQVQNSTSPRRTRWTMYEGTTHLKPDTHRRSSGPALTEAAAMSPKSAPTSPLRAPPPPHMRQHISQKKSIDTDAASVFTMQTMVMSATGPSSSYVIAVVGHEGVGKTSVIRRALKTWGGSMPLTTHTPEGHAISSSFTQITVKDEDESSSKTCHVEFVEVNLKALDTSGVSQVWPACMSQVSGAIFCYDAQRRDTLRGLSEALHHLYPAIPMVLFACKTDDPANTYEVAVQDGDSIGQPYNVGLIEVTTATSEGKRKMRSGLRWLLHRLEKRQRRLQKKAASVAAVAATAGLPPPPPPPVPVVTSSPIPQPQRERADSDLPTPATTPVTTPPTTSTATWRTQQDGQHGQEEEPHDENDITVKAIPMDTMAVAHISTPNSIPGTPSLESDKMPTPLVPSADLVETQWTSIAELMNRLFTAIVSTENDAFVQAFFMTYRRFCQPIDLMNEFHDRFLEVEQYAVSRDIRLWALMKLVGALQGWAARYPGDMVDSPTQVVFRTTVNYMIKYPFLGHITGDLVTIEQALDQTLDIDLSWSCQPPEPRPATPETAVPSEEKPAKADEEEQLEDTANGPPLELEPQPVGTPSLESGDQLAEPRKPRPISSDRTSASSSDVSRSVYSGDSMGHQRWASAISSVLQMDAHVFSLELTRMQWELFAAIRPRDILRHDLGKERGDPVARSIEFFNHVSRWVSTMILASPKPKTRAKVYEAFVKVAHQLRRLNNYDSLCAVISGLSEVSVVRLAQTRALVKLEPALVRDYQSHLKLMDTRLGHQLYRRALQADNTYGHTAIPLLTNILSLVSRLQAGRPEDRRKEDDLIQWGKFARMGKILSVIPDFQSRGTMAPGHASVTFRRLIEATPVIGSEDALYERSKSIEPPGSQPPQTADISARGGNMFRKLANLAL